MYTLEDNIRSAFRSYKQLQILVCQINLCFQPVVLPAMLCCIVAINVFGASLTFSRMDRLLDHVTNLFFPFIAIESMIAIVGLGTIAGFVNKRSIQYVNRVKKMISMDDQRTILHRKMAKSSSSMKIRFASNFVAISTPLVYSRDVLMMIA